MRTGEAQLVRDVSLDPDYRSASDDVRSEVSAPLFAGGELIGVLNVEDPRVGGLDETDRSTLALVAERLAGAIALGRDRRALTERAATFAALAEFAQPDQRLAGPARGLSAHLRGGVRPSSRATSWSSPCGTRRPAITGSRR